MQSFTLAALLVFLLSLGLPLLASLLLASRETVYDVRTLFDPRLIRKSLLQFRLRTLFALQALAAVGIWLNAHPEWMADIVLLLVVAWIVAWIVHGAILSPDGGSRAFRRRNLEAVVERPARPPQPRVDRQSGARQRARV